MKEEDLGESMGKCKEKLSTKLQQYKGEVRSLVSSWETTEPGNVPASGKDKFIVSDAEKRTKSKR